MIRGKTKKAKSTGMISVKLLVDVVGYGRQGSVIPVTRGRMRNLLYPRQKAAYVTATELRELKEQNVVIERDLNFGLEIPPENDQSQSGVQVERVAPEIATFILSENLPASLVFYRSPIPQPKAETPLPPLLFPQQYLSTTALDAAGGTPVVVDPKPNPIYGSVTTADIAESINALLAETEEGAKVVIGAHDVKIIRTEEESDGETDRLKTLGDFQVEIHVKGGGPVARTISIKAQEN